MEHPARTLVLILISTVLFVSSTAFAASYEQLGGTIVDPIRHVLGVNHSYSGNNLEPGVDQIAAELGGAFLPLANLDNATLTNAVLRGADLTTADLSGAILANAVGLSSSLGAALYDLNTDFTGTGFDPVVAGWTLVPVPEPGTALLLGLGLAGLAARRR